MKRKWYWMAPLGILAFAAFLFVGGEVVKLLWNWLLPRLFGWHLLTFWEALGLLALSRILFGGLGGHGPRPGPGWRFRHRCRNMSPEEREKFRKAMAEGYNVGGTAGEKATS